MISLRLSLPAVVLALLLSAAGCQSTRNWYESTKGDGFPEWSDQLGSGVRSPDPKAQPSGFFTDRRSEQIEQSLGGGF